MTDRNGEQNCPVVVVILPSLAYQIEQAVVAGARAVLEPAGYVVLSVVGGYLPAADEWADGRNWIYDYVAEQRLAGVLFYGGGVGYRAGSVPTQRLAGQFANIPLINLGCELDGASSVVADNFSGMKALTSHLLNVLGYRHLAFVHGPPCNGEAQERFNGFIAAHGEAQVSVDEQLMVVGDFTADGGRRAARALMANSRRPDAVVCANDLTAIGMLEELKALGIRVPDDIAVVGFDDFEYAVALEPPLTTVHYPATEMGAVAARMLLQQLAGEPSRERRVEVDAKPVLRRSAGNECGAISDDASTLYRDRWKQIQARDRHACRLRFDRAVFQAADLNVLFAEVGQLAQAAGFDHRYICTWDALAEGGPISLRYALREGSSVAINDERALVSAGALLPQWCELELSRASHGRLWVIHPLGVEGQRFGYLVTAVDEVVASFAESLGVQLSEAFNRQRLQDEAAARREELENSLEALRNAHLRLDKAEKIATLGRLVAGIGHELNTPVGAGITMASFIMEELTQLRDDLEAGKLSRPRLMQGFEQNYQAAESIFRNLVRTASLVELFKSSSSQSGERRVLDVALWEVVHTAFYRCKDELSAELLYDVDCSQSLRARTDVDALSSVLIHLIENAAAHAYAGRSDGRVRIEVRHDPLTRRFVMTFRDFGCGMDGEMLARLFEPFNTTHRGQGRTGLGLYLVYNLVSLRLRGIITVHSSPGKGTIYTLELPMLDDDGDEMDGNVISPLFAVGGVRGR